MAGLRGADILMLVVVFGRWIILRWLCRRWLVGVLRDERVSMIVDADRRV